MNEKILQNFAIAIQTERVSVLSIDDLKGPIAVFKVDFVV